jgi:hypothetical protein
VKVVFSLLLILITVNVFAAPLENGYALAPKTIASPEERAKAYINARQRVIEASRKYEGTPYIYGGMSAKGLDCSGFICLSFKDALSVALPRSAYGLYSWTEKTTLDKAQPGDFLFFKTDKSGNITHVALYLGERRFIHAASAGSKTGVIYSSLNEKYWANSYAGAGRAFPEVPSNLGIGNSSIADGEGKGVTGKPAASSSTGSGETRILAGIALAPIWNDFTNNGEPLRGFTSQLCFGVDTYSLGRRVVFSFELRPEYDRAFGIFRLPMTFSLGPSDKIKIFAGPVLCFGDASLAVDDNQDNYSGGISWLGTVGITAAPFIVKTSMGEFAPYIEAAWQPYFSDDADFSSGFRFSTGIRWLVVFNK